MSDTIVLPGGPPAPPANAQEARTRLDAFVADNGKGAKLLAGHVETNREFSELTAMAAGEDDSTIAAAMSGNIGDMPDSSVKLMANTADMLREIGVIESAIEQTLRGDPVSAQEFKLVEAHKARLMKDPVFVKAYLSGEPEPREKMTLCNIVLSSEIKKDEAK
jgi:hypothetical protein